MNQTLKVLTYNIHKGFSPGKLSFQLPKMRDAIADVNTDLVFLQEVQGEHKRREKRHDDWPDASQFEFLADTLWPHYAYGKNAIYQAGHHGNAILSKYPFKTWQNIDVSKSIRASRSLLHGQIQIPGSTKVVHVLCIHFGLFKSERLEQFKTLSDRIHELIADDEPLIIAGDFNDWQSAAVEYLEDRLHVQEVFRELEGKHAKTFPAIRPTLRTDRIYYRGLQLQAGECLNNKTWKLLSDHLPLYAEFMV